MGFVPSEWQLADIPTKPVGGVIFNHLIAMIMHKGITTVENDQDLSRKLPKILDRGG